MDYSKTLSPATIGLDFTTYWCDVPERLIIWSRDDGSLEPFTQVNYSDPMRLKDDRWNIHRIAIGRVAYENDVPEWLHKNSTNYGWQWKTLICLVTDSGDFVWYVIYRDNVDDPNMLHRIYPHDDAGTQRVIDFVVSQVFARDFMMAGMYLETPEERATRAQDAIDQLIASEHYGTY